MNRIVIAVVAVCLALFAAFFFGADYGGSKATLKAETKAARIQTAVEGAWRAALVAEVYKRHDSRLTDERKAREATEAHEKALKVLDQKHTAAVAAVRRAGGLRIPMPTACRPAAPGGQTAGAGGPDEGAAAGIELPERTQERLFALTLRAGQLTEQLIALQGWVRSNGFYGEPDGRANPGSTPPDEAGRHAPAADQH